MCEQCTHFLIIIIIMDDRKTTFLFQCISVLLFHFNSVLLHNSFELDARSKHMPLQSFLTFSYFFLPPFFRGFKKITIIIKNHNS